MNIKFIDFQSANKAMQDGKMVTRHGWPMGSFVFAQVPSKIPKEIILKMTSLPPAVKVELEGRGADLNYKDQLAFVNANSEICGYAPSVSDLNAVDWFVLP